jgi:hypothetical protein
MYKFMRVMSIVYLIVEILGCTIISTIVVLN